MVLNQQVGSEVERLMHDGQAAAKRGDKAMARVLLTQLLEIDPNNEHAWMWLSGAVSDPEEQQTCLENVLIINPQNEQARKGLEYIHAKAGSPPGATTQLVMSAQTAALAEPSGSSASSNGIGTASQPPHQVLAAGAALLEPEHKTGNEYSPVAEISNPVAGQAQGPFGHGPAQAPTLEGIAPFQMPDGANPQPYTGIPMPQESPPAGIGTAALDWANEAPFVAPGLEAHAPNSSQSAPTAPFDPTNISQTGAPFAPDSAAASGSADASLETDLNAWLEKVASEASGNPPVVDFANPSGAGGGLHTPEGNASNGGNPYPANPFASDSPDFGPAGPYASTQLPSPDELPGSQPSSNPAQPWYLQSSSDTIAAPPDFATDGAGAGEEWHQESSAKTVETIPCPNCHTNVPDTSLACPECRFSFFVHCPHCHELVDTSNATEGAVEGCPYCGVGINKMDLGLSNARGMIAPHAAPVESQQAWVGTGLVEPKQRKGFMLTFGWLVDLMWLLVIVLMIYALTQLPTWLHLTGLYN